MGIGQNSLVLKINSGVNIKYKTHFFSIEKRQQEIEKHKLILFSLGYISAFIKSKNNKDSLLEINFEIGKKYEWNLISESEKIKQIIPLNRFPKNLNSKIINEKINTLLSYCENNGYPFASVKLDSIQIVEHKINAKLNLQLNDFYTIDSIEIKGETKTSRDFILKTIGIKNKNDYNEQLIQKISGKINSIPFLETIKSPEVYFTKSKATLVLYIKDKNVSLFNGILGLNSNKITGKYEIIGDVNLDLRNVFKAGERLIFNWEKVKPNSQRYLISVKYPYLFKTKIGAEAKLNYYRQDSSFTNLDGKIGLNYLINTKAEFSIFTQNIQSNSLLNSTTSPNFPTINTLNTNYYGVKFLYNNLDYELNPRRGTLWNLEFSSGKKQITKDIDNIDIAYQNLENKITQQKIKIDISWFLPLFQKSTVLVKMQSSNIFSSQLFENELLQIGGLQTLRGFNEQSILASNYFIFSSEYRYLFSENSSVFTFFDYAYYENKGNNQFTHDTPFGFGIGVNFATNSGIFTLNYALGTQQNNPILVKNGKVHFGFVSLF